MTNLRALFTRMLFLIRVIDFLMAAVILPSAAIMLLYRRFGSMRLPASTAALRWMGVFPIRRHYYEPLFDPRDLRNALNDERPLPGIDFNIRGQLAFLKQLNRKSEVEELGWTKHNAEPTAFQFGNGSFESGDAEFLYQFVRHVKPRKIIEIGSGHSTKIARLARLRNELETGLKTAHVCIEPFEVPWLDALPDISLRRELVETSSVDWASELEDGDFLFIDSSHVIRPQGDVVTEYLQILPQLKSGVYVHVHDIFSPRDYLSEWINKDVKFWNEQYLLEAVMSNSSRYQIIAALNMLFHQHPEDMYRVCPYLTPEREPGSFYFQVR